MKPLQLEISAIRIDGGTQPRAQLNESAVAEYAEAMTEGVSLPAVTVFFDGSEYWLADGFHRYHGHKRIGALKIATDVINGTRRDAVLHSVGANATHGLRRTNEDKRRAVETLLHDAEWAKWSDREIARKCGVSHDFANRIRKESLSSNDSERPAERTYTTKHGTTATMQTAGIGKTQAESPASNATLQAEPPVAPQLAPRKPAAQIAPAPAGEAEELRDQLSEISRNLQDTIADNESMARVFEADDKLAAAIDEAKRYREQNRILEDRVRGLMNEKNEAIRLAKSWQRKCEKLERDMKAAANNGIDPSVGF